ncbi:uncharacterized protein B0H18DRAFT_664851 [Fomitopsis serialis]|uniref:uncharacterized protein n=1 Tax=Fomitopsis serialis TaxID=139415 RepID=UPI0020088E20|nr:uncharacterized protein B0H18DRAFT_664851 [Neoantrodia serialis]KAH9918593.1 hypothetical protein B0H18DRAFT_664851 [Neoantrodia serialis]
MSAHPDLYRSGNTTNGGGWDKVRPQDISEDSDGNVHPGKKGMSCFNKMQSGFKPTSTWVLRSTTSLPTGLSAVRDGGAHYVIAPASVMPMSTYKTHLASLNHLTVRYDKLNTVQSGVEAIPRTSTHASKSVQFVANALLTVYHEQTAIPDWDANDYACVASLAMSLDSGEIQLSDVSWKEGSEETKSQYLVAQAIGAFIHAERTARAPLSEDEHDEMPNDHAVLVSALDLDEASNPLQAVMTAVQGSG